MQCINVGQQVKDENNQQSDDKLSTCCEHNTMLDNQQKFPICTFCKIDK